MRDALDGRAAPGDLQPQLGARGLRPPAQRPRRRARDARRQRRRLHGDVRAARSSARPGPTGGTRRSDAVRARGGDPRRLRPSVERRAAGGRPTGAAAADGRRRRRPRRPRARGRRRRARRARRRLRRHQPAARRARGRLLLPAAPRRAPHARAGPRTTCAGWGRATCCARCGTRSRWPAVTPAGVLLAAGAGRRMGGPKALLRDAARRAVPRPCASGCCSRAAARGSRSSSGPAPTRSAPCSTRPAGPTTRRSTWCWPRTGTRAWARRCGRGCARWPTAPTSRRRAGHARRPPGRRRRRAAPGRRRRRGPPRRWCGRRTTVGRGTRC